MYKNILFDLDGTLSDPKEGITKSVQYALAAMGIESDAEELTMFIGPPLIYSFTHFYNMTEEKAMEAIVKYRERFEEKGMYENYLYDGIEKLLKELKNNGKFLAVATSKPKHYAKMILDYFGISKYFDVIEGPGKDGIKMTKTEVITNVIKKSGIDVCDTVMIGDRFYDIEGANNNKMESIGVTYGFAQGNELEEAGATHIVKRIEDIYPILLA